MSSIVDALRTLASGVANIQTTGVIRERLELLKSQLLLAQDEMEKLRSENSRLMQYVEELKREKAARAVAEQYTPHRGALFRRDASGAWEPVAHCPVCMVSVAAFPHGDPDGVLHCGRCGWAAPFSPGDLPAVLAQLPRP